MNSKETLKAELIKYRDITVELIKDLEKDYFDNIESSVKRRQEVLDFIINSKFSKEDGKEIFEELKLQQLNDQLIKLMERNLEIIKEKSYNFSKVKAANNVYNANRGAKIFSKKI